MTRFQYAVELTSSLMTLTFHFLFNIIRVILRQSNNELNIYMIWSINIFLSTLWFIEFKNIKRLLFFVSHYSSLIYFRLVHDSSVSDICINASNLLSRKTQYLKPKICGTHTVYVDFELKSNWSSMCIKLVFSFL